MFSFVFQELNEQDFNVVNNSTPSTDPPKISDSNHKILNISTSVEENHKTDADANANANVRDHKIQPIDTLAPINKNFISSTESQKR